MASIFKPAGDSKYRILYTDENGKRRQQTGATDKEVTERIANDLEEQVAIEPGRQEERRTKAAAALTNALKSVRLSLLETEKIQAALATLLDAGKAPQTVNHYRAAIRAFCLWAQRTKRTRDNPMLGVA